MEWIVLSVFPAGHGWIPSFVESRPHRFTFVEPFYRHDRSRARASASDWRDYLVHALRAWRRAASSSDGAGFITVFPQLALLIGILKRLTFSRRPVVAWMFNFGRTHGGLQGIVARFGYAAVDRFVVHSTHEIDVYSRWLRLPRERFVFVPLSVDDRTVTEMEDCATPFVVSMGTANRDYAILIDALRDTPYRAVIVAGPHALSGLAIPDGVEVVSGLSEVECQKLCQRARLSIVPLKNLHTAAGQVTVVEAMMFGRPVIATRSVGTVDYVQSGVDGVLVGSGDAAELRVQIDRLWNDADARLALSQAARRSAFAKFTFRAVALDLETLLSDLA